MAYHLKAVENDGDVLATFATADATPRHGINITSVDDELNQPGGCSFGGSLWLPDADVLDIGVGVQVYRDGITDPLFWGVVVNLDDDSQTGQFSAQAAGSLYPFSRLFLGKADRTNYLDNPQFESNLTDWTATGGVTATADTSRVNEGVKSAKLDQATDGANEYLSQTVSISSTAIGDFLTIAAWVWISDADWVGPAAYSLGIYVEGSLSGVVQDTGFVQIDESTPRDQWVRLETDITMPASVTWDVEVRLFAPGGIVYWDSISVTKMESFAKLDYDVATICEDLVHHGQNTAFGKTDLNIAQSCPTSGVLKDFVSQYADHENIKAALDRWLDYLDFAVTQTATQRTFRTYYPTRGTTRATTLNTSRIAWVRRTLDGGSAANSVVTLGDGDGPDREEGSAIDTGALAGSTWEEIIQAPAGTPVGRLNDLAAEELRARSNPRSIEVTLKPGEQIGTAVPGDIYPVSFSKGRLDLSGDWRVAKTHIDPPSDRLTLSMVPT